MTKRAFLRSKNVTYNGLKGIQLSPTRTYKYKFTKFLNVYKKLFLKKNFLKMARFNVNKIFELLIKNLKRNIFGRLNFRRAILYENCRVRKFWKLKGTVM